MFPSRKRRVSMRSSHAIRTLRRLKDLHPDDMVKLDFILVSEMSPVIRCHNHSMTIRAERQLDIVYRHHALTMRKISKGQHAAYQNLMKVKNDRRRIHRESVIRRREAEVFDYQSARTARDRVEAEVRMLERLTLDDGEVSWSHYIHTNDWTNIGERADTTTSEDNTRGWLRIRRRKTALERNRLPSSPNRDNDAGNWVEGATNVHKDTSDNDIYSVDEVNERKSKERVVPSTRASKAANDSHEGYEGASFPITSANVSDIGSRGKSPRVRVARIGGHKVNSSNASVIDSHDERLSKWNNSKVTLTSPKITITDSGVDTTTDGATSERETKDRSTTMCPSMDDGKKTVKSQPGKAEGHLSTNGAMIDKRAKSFAEADSDSDGSVDVGLNKSNIGHLGSTEQTAQVQNSSEEGHKQGSKASRKTSSERLEVKEDPTTDSTRYHTDITRYSTDSTGFGSRKPGAPRQSNSTGTSKTKSNLTRSSRGKIGDGSLATTAMTRRTTTRLEMKQTDGWGGTTTYKAIRLPELKLTPIEQVIRYQREASGKLVGTPAAVHPSSEMFQIPSKRADYCRRRALQRQIEQYGSLDAKVDRFLMGCDSVPRPSSTLGSGSSIYLFLRHNPMFVQPSDSRHGNSPFSSTHEMHGVSGDGKNKPVKSV